jgi:hypothetical protein
VVGFDGNRGGCLLLDGSTGSDFLRDWPTATVPTSRLTGTSALVSWQGVRHVSFGSVFDGSPVRVEGTISGSLRLSLVPRPRSTKAHVG